MERTEEKVDPQNPVKLEPPEPYVRMLKCNQRPNPDDGRQDVKYHPEHDAKSGPIFHSEEQEAGDGGVEKARDGMKPQTLQERERHLAC